MRVLTLNICTVCLLALIPSACWTESCHVKQNDELQVCSCSLSLWWVKGGAWRTHWELCVCVCCVCFACVWVHLSEGECDGVSRQLRTETSVLSPLYKSNRKPQGSCHFATNVLSAREKEFISVFQSVCIQGSVACFPTQLLKRHCGKC